MHYSGSRTTRFVVTNLIRMYVFKYLSQGLWGSIQVNSEHLSIVQCVQFLGNVYARLD
jgi:hypothetical protein